MSKLYKSKKEKPSKKIYRIIDANFNRCHEGLRVCEELTRFFLNDRNFTKRFKRLRHNLEKIINSRPTFKKKLLQARDVRTDVGRKILLDEFEREDVKDIFDANLQRVKEATRVLEEFLKLIDRDLAPKFKEMRFKIYNLEKVAVEKLETIHHIG